MTEQQFAAEGMAPITDEDAGEIAVAPMLSRMLAAFIDYLVLTSLSIFTMRFIENPDLLFVPNFIVGALYLGIGSSWITGGQTLGKKAFGIKVLGASAVRSSPYLGLLQSIWRYFCLVGFIVILSDVPAMVYRRLGFVGEPMLLEFHMWIALVYSITGVTLVLLSGTHRGLHDLLARTVVVKGPISSPEDGHRACKAIPAVSPLKSPLLISPVVGAAFGTLLWLHGIETNQQVHGLVSHRFDLEHRFPIRIQGIVRERDYVILVAEVSPSYSLSVRPPPESNELAVGLAREAVEQKLIDTAEIKNIVFNFSRITPNEQTGLTFKVDQLSVDTTSLEVKPLSPEF